MLEIAQSYTKQMIDTYYSMRVRDNISCHSLKSTHSWDILFDNYTISHNLFNLAIGQGDKATMHDKSRSRCNSIVCTKTQYVESQLSMYNLD